MKRVEYTRSHESRRAAMRAANKACRFEWRRWLRCGWWVEVYEAWA